MSTCLVEGAQLFTLVIRYPSVLHKESHVCQAAGKPKGANNKNAFANKKPSNNKKPVKAQNSSHPVQGWEGEALQQSGLWGSSSKAHKEKLTEEGQEKASKGEKKGG